jgi:methanethiol S-methyltransferase
MPVIQVKVLDNVFTPAQKSQMITKLTDVFVSIKGENIRPVTSVEIEEVRRGEWGIGRVTAFVYGIACYLAFLAAFLYAVGFLGNFGVPKSIDSGPQSPFLYALAINFALLGLFAVQHSVMARQWFKAAWTRIVPTPVERSTYVLLSSLALLLLFWKWQPMGGVIWNIESTSGQLAVYALYASGWLTVLITTFLINHFDLFGLRQVWLHLRRREYTPLGFRTPGVYRHVRHPLYVGWLLVFWSAPVMTAAHLVFAIATTAYIFVGVQFEERDLVRFHGEYAKYRRRVPMFLPIGSSKQRESSEGRQIIAKQEG